MTKRYPGLQGNIPREKIERNVPRVRDTQIKSSHIRTVTAPPDDRAQLARALMNVEKRVCSVSKICSATVRNLDETRAVSGIGGSVQPGDRNDTGAQHLRGHHIMDERARAVAQGMMKDPELKSCLITAYEVLQNLLDSAQRLSTTATNAPPQAAAPVAASDDLLGSPFRTALESLGAARGALEDAVGAESVAARRRRLATHNVSDPLARHPGARAVAGNPSALIPGVNAEVEYLPDSRESIGAGSIDVGNLTDRKSVV